MNATYLIHALNGLFAEIVETSTGVRIYLAKRAECIQFAERFGLNYRLL